MVAAPAVFARSRGEKGQGLCPRIWNEAEGQAIVTSDVSTVLGAMMLLLLSVPYCYRLRFRRKQAVPGLEPRRLMANACLDYSGVPTGCGRD